MPLLSEIKQIKCDSCNSTFDDIVNTGRYGCPNCYDVFEDRMDPILKKLQGANRHSGRLGKISENNVKYQEVEKNKIDNGNKNKIEVPEHTICSTNRFCNDVFVNF